MPNVTKYQIKTDTRSNPPFIWCTVFDCDKPVAKAKMMNCGNRSIIKFLTVVETAKGCGVGRFLINRLQKNATVLIAENVRFSSKGFWQKLGFTRLPHTDNFIWNKN